MTKYALVAVIAFMASALLWAALVFSLDYGRLPYGSGELWNWIFGWGLGG